MGFILSSQVISDCFRVLLNFESSYDTLDDHEAAVDQYVSTTGLNAYNLSFFLPQYLSRPSRTRPTSIIAAATITIRGAHDRLDKLATINAYTRAGKGSQSHPMGCAARTRSGWLLRMRSDGMGSASDSFNFVVYPLLATISYCLHTRIS